MHPALAFAAAAVAKAGFWLWLGGIAADPLAEDARKEFLDKAESVLRKLALLERLPAPEKLQSLREDIEILRSRESMGWEETYEFMAANRIMNFIGWERTKGATFGIGRLMRNGTEALGTYAEKKSNEAVDTIFGPRPNSDPPHDNRAP
jgi:hypothetical protein